MKSEVLDNYFKIATEQGLIEKSAYPQTKTYTSGFKDNRQGSDDISTVEALYGVKPNGKEDDKDIIEKAHPSTVVVSPAYDKFNGVVENVRERQNIMSNVALKNPNGNYSQKRYASATQDLVESLVRVGFVLDNNNQDKLRELADSCSEMVVKEAGWFRNLFLTPRSYYSPSRLTGTSWALIGGLGAILGTAAILSKKEKTFDQGTVKNLNLLEEKIKETKDEYPKLISGFIEDFSDTTSEVSKSIAALRNLKLVSRDKDTAEQFKEHIKKIDNFKKLAEKFKEQFEEIKPILESEAEAVSSGGKDDVEPSNQFTAGLKSLYRHFSANPAKELLQAANTVSENLDEELHRLEILTEKAKSKAEKIESMSKKRSEIDAEKAESKSKTDTNTDKKEEEKVKLPSFSFL